ncbi:hypothetical protein J2X97_002253 [Epilithonimonas hungarica]|uniref:hypothetical protein n=1 Tax=Epilithonimonas hungarica TaxID=454006 RepID=UPI002785A878|nr:hypothetical protein [Epilithonimonas hungarica]MDP9956594.1 hypothetical protein [Epilithonimonas hungarica]
MKKQKSIGKKLEALTNFGIRKNEKSKITGGSVLPYYNFPGYTSMSGSGGCTGTYSTSGSGTDTCGSIMLD